MNGCYALIFSFLFIIVKIKFNVNIFMRKKKKKPSQNRLLRLLHAPDGDPNVMHICTFGRRVCMALFSFRIHWRDDDILRRHAGLSGYDIFNLGAAGVA